MRPSKEETFLKVAQVVAERGTCVRRKVGCVLVNSLGHILATGYNGVARGLTHCTDKPCAGAGAPSGEKLEACEAIHAEQNALLQCKNTQEIDVCYTTVSPCLHCVKLLMNTGCKKIVFLEEYAKSEVSKSLWYSSRGRILSWVKFGSEESLPIQIEMDFEAKFVHPRKFGNIRW